MECVFSICFIVPREVRCVSFSGCVIRRELRCVYSIGSRGVGHQQPIILSIRGMETCVCVCVCFHWFGACDVRILLVLEGSAANNALHCRSAACKCAYYQ